MLAMAMLGGVITVLHRPPPPDARASYAAAMRQMQAGNYSATRNDAQRAITADPRSVPAHLALARAYLELGDAVGAEGAVARAHTLGLAPARTRHLLAWARVLQGDLAGALAEAAKPMPADAGEGIRTLARMRARALAAQGTCRAHRRR